MKRNHAAFTLIELLVVIAIIAILAAILFPVFAQAKKAAQHAVTLSNQKQVVLAQQMYAGDYDDVLPVRGTTNGDGYSWGVGWCTADLWGCPSWDKLAYPYMKNYQLFKSNLDKTPSKPSNLGDIKRSFSAAQNVYRTIAGIPPSWGAPASGYWKAPLSLTSIPSPAGTIALTEHRNWLGTFSGDWWIWSTFWEMWVWGEQAKNTLSGDDISVIKPSYGHDGTWFYAGVDFSNSNKAAYAFADGHVASFAKGKIFDGYEKRLSVDDPVDDTLPGVCIDANEWTADTAVDCKLPQ